MGRDTLEEYILSEMNKLKPIGDERYVHGLLEAYQKVLYWLEENA